LEKTSDGILKAAKLGDLKTVSGIVRIVYVIVYFCHIYSGADKSLARPGRKQATVTEDFYVHISCLLS